MYDFLSITTFPTPARSRAATPMRPRALARGLFAGALLAVAPLLQAHENNAATPHDTMAAHEHHGMHDHAAESYDFGHPGTDDAVTRTVAIDATDLKFNPTTVQVHVGDTIRFVIHNSGQVDHEFMLADAAAQAAHDQEMAAMPEMKMDHPNGVRLRPGETVSLIWTFTKAAQLQFACHVPGHYAAGMLGQLIVQ